MPFESSVAPQHRSTVLVLILCTVVTLFEGFDLQAAGVAAPKLAGALALSPQQLGWFFSSSTFGLMAGAALGGRLSDRLGRKPALIVSVALFGLMSSITGFVDTFDHLVLARFLTGVGLGGAWPNSIAITAEHMPPSRRSGAVGWLYAGMPLGGALASCSSLIGSASSDWRLIFWLGGLGPLIAVPILLRYLVVSPVSAGPTAGPRGSAGILQALLGERRLGLTALLWLASFLALLILYLLLNWLPSLLVSRGLSRPDAAYVQLIFNAAGTFGSVLVGRKMDVPSWRILAPVAAFAVTAAALLAVARVPASLAACLAIGAVLGAGVMACQSIIYGLAPACYPSAVRGTGVGLAVSVGRLGSAAGPLLAAQLLGAGRPPTQVLMSLLPFVVVAGLATSALSARAAKTPVA